MLHRRNSTDSHQSYGGRRPLTLISNNRNFGSSAVNVESPQSGVFEHDTPPMPPRPMPMPPRPMPMPSRPMPLSQLLSGNGRLKRRSTRHNTCETFSSPPNFSGPLSSVPISALPHAHTPGHPHSVPVGPQQPFGEGIGGFAATPLPPRGSNNGHRHAVAYVNRFGTGSSPNPDADFPHYESADISGGIHANLWPIYNKVSMEFDERRLQKWYTELDVLLIFSALFSVIVAAFLIKALGDLEPDYQQQSALLLYQLLNGLDHNLANLSDPTIPFKPSGFTVATNCLWFASLSASLSAGFGAMICKEWLAEYNSDANPVVDLLRACRRQIRFMAFKRLNIDIVIALLPAILHSSVLLFFTGAVVYVWKIDLGVAVFYLLVTGMFAITYLISTFLPFVIDAPFRTYSTILIHRLYVAVGKVAIQVVDVVARACSFAIRRITVAILLAFARIIPSKDNPPNSYPQDRTALPRGYKDMRIRWANASSDSLDEIDTSQRIQDQAILWLSQMPLDLSESRVVVSSLALIPSSRPHRFPRSVIVFLNLTLDSLFRDEPGQESTDAATDCVIALGRIKFQSAVDRNSDQDHSIREVPVTPLVGWAAQQLTAHAFDNKFNTPHTEGIRTRLLVAAAWLSPVDGIEESLEGQKVKIQDRSEFIEKIEATLARHVRGHNTLERKDLIELIHGMHACIPRGNYGNASSVISFLPTVCEDYDSPWSEDESVLRALVTYALDLLLSSGRRKPLVLVDQEIEFCELASELLDVLMVNTTYADVAMFGLWLIYRVPYAFKSRKSIVTDIAHIWASMNEGISEDVRERVAFHAIDSLVAAFQYHTVTNGALPKLASHDVLNLLKAAVESDYSKPMATYATAMVLNLGSPTQVATFTREVLAEPFARTLYTIQSDLEGNTAEEDVVDLHIYSALVLLKLQQPQVDVERVKALVWEMEKTIRDEVVGDSENPEVDINIDLNRVRWKAVYLTGLLFKFIPPGEKDPIESLRERVRALLLRGGLPTVGDYERCLEPLGMDEAELVTIAQQQGPTYTAFEEWIDGFPLFPLAGSVTSVKTHI